MPQPRGSTPPNALNCSGNASTSLAQDTTPNLGASSWPGPGPEFMPISGAKSLDDTHTEGALKYWAAERPLREAERTAVSAAAAHEIGLLNDREILIAGAVAYWCEGGKNKPHRRDDRVSFINSDPALVKFFLRFLDVAGIEPGRLVFRAYIHESADIDAAQRFWLDVTQADPAQFRSPTLKRHNAKTVRKNTGDDYHGCLRIDVLCSTELYRKIEGWAEAAMRGPNRSDEAAVSAEDRAHPPDCSL